MHLPLRRIFDEKRRLVIPVLARRWRSTSCCIAGVVYPLGVRVRSTEARAAGGCAGSCRPPSATMPRRAASRRDAIARTPR